MKKGLLLILIVAALASTALGFFMFTTTQSSPTPMELYIPNDDRKVDKFAGVKSKLTFILLKNDKVFGYYGEFIRGGKTISIDKTNDMINEGRKMFPKDTFVIVIKPGKQATYKATVDMLDAMTINQISSYTMVDIDKKEKEFLKIDE